MLFLFYNWLLTQLNPVQYTAETWYHAGILFPASTCAKYLIAHYVITTLLFGLLLPTQDNKQRTPDSSNSHWDNRKTIDNDGHFVGIYLWLIAIKRVLLHRYIWIIKTNYWSTETRIFSLNLVCLESLIFNLSKFL